MVVSGRHIVDVVYVAMYTVVIVIIGGVGLVVAMHVVAKQAFTRITLQQFYWRHNGSW